MHVQGIMHYYFRQHNVSHGFPKIASGVIFFQTTTFLKATISYFLNWTKKAIARSTIRLSSKSKYKWLFYFFVLQKPYFANASRECKFWQDTCIECIQNAKSLYHDFILNNQSIYITIKIIIVILSFTFYYFFEIPRKCQWNVWNYI